MVRSVLFALALVFGVADPAAAVVGGAPAARGDFPWVVRLSDGCDGSLVAPRVVLTAAHCVNNVSAVRVTAGAVNLRDGITVASTAIRVAPGYGSGLGGDWALVQLAMPLNVPVLALTPSSAYDHGTFVVVGWGATHEGGVQQRHLRWASVPFVSDRRCGRAYREDGYDDDAMICAGNGGVDACQGDSGGPLIRPDATGTWVEVGIVSFGYGCARPGYPGVYTQVSTYLPAITAVLDALR
jgi:secreted trypsin-like serine protease